MIVLSNLKCCPCHTKPASYRVSPFECELTDIKVSRGEQDVECRQTFRGFSESKHLKEEDLFVQNKKHKKKLSHKHLI